MLSLTLALFVPQADASGFYQSDTGLRSLGRGSAFVAGADDLTAQYHNPAALVRLTRPQVMLNAVAVSQYISFDRADTDDQVYDAVTNGAAPYIIPNVGFGMPIGDRTAFAVGFFTPYAPTFEYPADGAQRHSLVSSSVIETNFGPSIAHRVFPWLTLGAGATWKMMGANQELVLSTASEGDEIYDIGVDLSVVDRAEFSWNAGLLVEPTEWLALGASITPPVTYSAAGTVTADLENNNLYTSELLLDQSITDEDVFLTLTMPMALRFGAMVRPNDRIEVEAGFYWVGWNIIEELLLTDVQLALHPNTESALLPDDTPAEVVADDDIALPGGYTNAWSVRGGIDAALTDIWSVRAGGLYETSAIPLSSMSVNLVDGEKVGYSLGATWRPNSRWALDGAWAQTFLFPQTIDESEYALVHIEVDPSDLEGTGFIDGEIVANGLYESRQQVFGLGLTYLFGGEG